MKSPTLTENQIIDLLFTLNRTAETLRLQGYEITLMIRKNNTELL